MSRMPHAILPALVIALSLPSSALAQWKPAKEVEVVVPNSPGGGNDTLARLIQRIWKDRQIVTASALVSNKPGGAGNVALQYLSQRHADGQSMAIVSVTQQLNYITGNSTVRHTDFTPMAVLLGDYVAFAVRADSPIRTGKDLMDRLRKDPGSASVGVTGIGGNNHVALVMAARSAGVDTRKLRTPVFSSSAESITAMLGGHIDVHSGSVGPLSGQMKAGQIRVIAISSEQRLAGDFAQAPTWKDQGISGVFNTWRGLWGPKGMAAPQLAYWDKALAQLTQSSEWKKELETRMWADDYMDSRATQKYLDGLHAEMRAVLKEIGLAKNMD
jgi:putative tricarboxylic transport membrane protein